MSASPGGRRRTRFAALALVVLALVVAVRRGDFFGDRGMTNVLTGLILLLAGLVTLAWFLLRGPASRAVRLGVLGSLLAGAALVRIDGVSAEMVPELAWRFAPRRSGATSTRPEATERGARAVDLATTAPSDFPGFLGPRRDQTLDGPALATDWSREPPKLRWRAACGAGWSGFALVNGWAVTMEQDADGQHVTVRDLATGALAWKTRVEEPFFHVLGGDGPRATPSVAGGRVFALGAHGRLVCLDGASGTQLWAHDLPAEHGLAPAQEAELVQYGRSNSPLVVGDLVVVPAGGAPENGQAGLVAFEAASGALRFASPGRALSHSSPARAKLCGVEQLLIVNEASVSGHDAASGRMLWEHPWPAVTSGDANCSQALAVGPERVFVSKGYGGGGLLLELAPAADGACAVREVWHNARALRTKFTNVVLHGGFLYALDDGVLECVELASGALRWKEGRYGHGQILLVGELLLVVSEEGEVLLLAPDPARPNEVLGRFQGLAGKCWAHLALAGPVLALRNAEECAAWELPLAR